MSSRQVVLILDFGSQYDAAHRAARPREQGLLRDSPGTLRSMRSARRPARHHPLGRPVERLRRERAARATRGSSSSACPCSASATAMQLMAHLLGGKVERASEARVRPREASTVEQPRGHLPPLRDGESIDVWMSHGDRVDGAAARAFARSAATRQRAALPRSRTPSASCTASSSIPRSCTRRAARSVLASVPLRRRGARARLDAGLVHRRRDRGSSASRCGPNERAICGLSGGVDSSVAAVLCHKAHRRSAHVHLRRQRHAAAGRVRAGRQHVPRRRST